MSNEQLNEALECLRQELDERTPLTDYTDSANVALIREFFTLHPQLVEEAVTASTEEDGTLNPFGLTKRLLQPLLAHCGDRVSPPII